MHVKFLSTLAICALMFIAACDDQGDPVTVPSSTAPAPVLSAVSPDSGKANDTITVTGTNFGSTQGTGVLTFGSVNATSYISWNATQIKVIVPSGVTAGAVNVTVTAGGKASNTKSFKSLSTVAAVKFSTDILPLFNSYGCIGCHGSNGGLSVGTVAALLTGGTHGPAIVANNADNSNLVKKLRSATLPVGSKMPANGGNVSDQDLQTIKDWINQGALNN